MKKSFISFIIIATIFASVSLVPARAAETFNVAIIAPDLPFTQAEGENYINQFISILAASIKMKPESFKGKFFNNLPESKKYVSQNKNVFVMGSLGFFLSNRKWLNLVPVASVDYSGSDLEQYYVVVKKGKYRSLSDLKGKSMLSSAFFEDKKFINKFVFNGEVDAYSYFKTSFTTSIRGAVRNLERGKVESVLLNHRDYLKFQNRKDFASLDIIYRSEKIPTLGLMMTDTPANRDMKEKFLGAVIKMNDMPEAQTMFRANGISGFRNMNTGLIDAAITKFDGGN